MDIFDEIIACMKSEAAFSGGRVYVSRKNLVEYLSPVQVSQTPAFPPQMQTFSQRQTAGPVLESRKDFLQPPVQPPVCAAKPLPDVSRMDLAELENTVRNCTACRLCSGRHNTVFSDGNAQAELMFIGEGPGEDEDLQGIPFVGRAGQLLTKMIQAMQFDRSEVYIANIVKCRPPGNRNPEEDEAAICIPYLKRQIELVNPKVIVLLGAVPLKYLMKRTGITKLRGNWLEYNSIPVMPTLHPAYLLRNPAAKAGAWSDLKQVMARFGKQVPVHKAERS